MALFAPDLPAALPVAAGHTHKAAPGEILLTGWCPLGEDTFTVTARWPAEHAYYVNRRGAHDPLLVAETVRQCILLLSHAAYGVPLDHRQIWDRLSLTTHPAALAADGRPAVLRLRIVCRDVRRTGGVLRSAALHAEAVRVLDGSEQRLATAHTRFTSHSPTVYRRLRGPYADLGPALERALPVPLPLAPVLVARARPDDVVLAPTPVHRRWQLRCDTAHPVLFDHPVDHVPGMLLLEAARQAAHAFTGAAAAPTRIECAFARFTELDTPAWITAARHPDTDRTHHVTRVAAGQFGTDVVTATVVNPAA
ncbi:MULTISPECIES: ScbA/BarX family gamma-butyrolactone biosynthesis protein [unclassified Streptomyces]|uniref:ScbA/BarX family gamma-butyrolactone biosynthesis protein n=1 Tax=unclassified Streptomyces TaxID=2593676 RepID=UPI002E2D320D|nr:ScbA/BarX family gamma-butyrolactone biosynthesis protein [Streptomyces sp. NBC_00223]